MADPTPKQLDTLRHMLGINDPYMKVPKPWRNYYCANPGDKHMMALAEIGLVEMYMAAGTGPTMDYYRCTARGETLAIASHKSIRKSKAKRLYSRFLDCCDAFDDLTFRQFLTDPAYAETRRNA